MSWFDKLTGRKVARTDDPTLDGEMPNLQASATADESLSAMASRAHAERHGQAAAEHGATAPNSQLLDDELPSVNRRKNSSKAVNILGIVAIVLIGGALAWKLNAPKEPKKPKATAQQDKVVNNLPRLELPKPAPPAAVAPIRAAAASDVPTVDAAGNQVPAIEGGTAARPIPLRGNAANPGPRGAQQRAAGTANAQGHGREPMSWHERKMHGDVMLVAKRSGADEGDRPGSPDGSNDGLQFLREVMKAQQPAGAAGAGSPAGGGESDDGGGSLSSRLQPTKLKGASASVLPDRNFLLTKGTPLDCVLDTAIITSLPSIIVCHLTRDVYSANGQVLLFERGTKMVGEQQGAVRRGAARVFAIWSRAETPHGVIIDLNSPGTDALGRGGLEGWVDHHFAERFGAAILMSFIQDSLQALVESQKKNGGTSVYTGSAESGSKVVEKILESTVNIPPTVIKNQGDHIQVMVARDLDFSDVYQLRKAR